MFKDDIFELAVQETKCRVYFKSNRTPMYGKFVLLSDYTSLIDKNMIRFVNHGFQDQFNEARHVKFSRIFDISTLAYYKIV